jgi:hypothetical protein
MQLAKREDEEYCRQMLEQHLSQDHLVLVEDYASDPPDYFFTVDGVRFAHG